MSANTQPATLPVVTPRTKAEYLAAIEDITSGIIDALRLCTDEQLRKATTAEGWPVVVVAHHACSVQHFFAGIFSSFLAGEDIPAVSADDVEHGNAAHANEFANVSRDETIACLEQGASELKTAIGKFAPEQFEEVVGTIAGFPMNSAQILEFGLLGHLQEHLTSIRETIAA